MNISPRLLIGMLFILLIILLLPVGCRYVAPIQGSEGYSVLLVTDPGYFGSALKWTADLLERTPCRYELKGWGEDNRLYYSAACRQRPAQLFVFDPTTAVSQMTDLPAVLIHDPFSTREIIDFVHAPGVRPKSEEPFVRHIYLPDTGLRSPDGAQWAMITRRVYSVYDIVVLTADSDAIQFGEKPQSPVPTTIAFPQQKEVVGTKRETEDGAVAITVCMLMLAKDELVLEDNCLWLGGPPRSLVIWPADFSLHIDGDHIEVHNADGETVARVGEWVSMGGGFTPVSDYELYQVPTQCRQPENYWIACPFDMEIIAAPTPVSLSPSTP